MFTLLTDYEFRLQLRKLYIENNISQSLYIENIEKYEAILLLIWNKIMSNIQEKIPQSTYTILHTFYQEKLYDYPIYIPTPRSPHDKIIHKSTIKLYKDALHTIRSRLYYESVTNHYARFFTVFIIDRLKNMDKNILKTIKDYN